MLDPVSPGLSLIAPRAFLYDIELAAELIVGGIIRHLLIFDPLPGPAARLPPLTRQAVVAMLTLRAKHPVAGGALADALFEDGFAAAVTQHRQSVGPKPGLSSISPAFRSEEHTSEL